MCEVSEREEVRLRLLNFILRSLGGRSEKVSPIPGVAFHRWTEPSPPLSCVMPPSVCMIVQGSKRVILGEESYVYDETSFLVTSVDLPLVVQVMEASEARPYVGMTLELNPEILAQLIIDDKIPSSAKGDNRRGIAVDSLGLPLLRALSRLLELEDEPESVSALAPVFHTEILYRLMQTKPGPRIRQIGAMGSHHHQISGAIKWIKEHLNERLSVPELAQRTGMSSTTLHQHFKALTALSPLQFQKRLRLNEARRLMMVEHVDAATAAFRVGYESPSQFSREYRRLFGAPPRQDIKDATLPEPSSNGRG